MAFKTLAPPDVPGGDLQFLYNVSLPVGPAKDNQEPGVQLVQLCLQNAFENPNSNLDPFPGGHIEVDGKFGFITQQAIFFFQLQVEKGGGSIRADGVVNRAGSSSAISQISGTVFTIVQLNLALRAAIGDGRFNRLEDDSITPFGLQVALAASVA
jgi:hypothetical protein